jgi:HAMP domain-containing protein
MRWGIRHQFFVPLLLLLLGLAGVCTWTALASARAAERRIAAEMDSIVQMMTGDKPRPALDKRVLELMKELSAAEFILLDRTGQRLATLSDDFGELPPISRPAEGAESSLGERVAVGGRQYYCRGLLLRPPGANVGARLYILYPESLRDEAVWQAVRPTLILGVTAGIAALVLMLIGTGGVVRRLRDLERRTRQVAAGEFSPMPLPRRDDELRDLAQSVNEMAAKLAAMRDAVAGSERDRLLGQVSAGLAHQLRNAVTGGQTRGAVARRVVPGR